MAESTNVDREYGTIITFYSYKGGVGRSMALANIGCLMALEGKKVLLIDWDLEAPGLEKYFSASGKTRSNSIMNERNGIVDLLESLTTGAAISWLECVSTVEFLGTGVDVITAGRRDANYRKRVQSIDWGILYDEHDFGGFIEEFREEIAQVYDYILIDSRTGITDIGDVCTVLLPDVLLTLFVSNEQNIEGTMQIVERARKARSRLPVDRAKLIALPLPSRDESDSEYDLTSSWRERYATDFRKLLGEWLPKEISAEDYFDRIYIPYVAVWSFGERLPVLENPRELRDPKSLGVSLQNVCRLLVNKLDWYALGDERNVSEITAAKTELRVAEERHDIETQKIVTRASKFRRRALLSGAIGAFGTTVGGVALWNYFLNSAPSVALAITLRRPIGARFTAASFSSGEPIRSNAILATGNAVGDVSFQLTETSNVSDIFGGHLGKIESIAFSPNGLAVSGDADGSVRLWDAIESRSIGNNILSEHDGAVHCVAFSPDGNRIVSGSADGTIRLWNAATGRQIGAPFEGHEESVRSVAFSPDGHRIVSGSQDGTLCFWDAATGVKLGAPFTVRGGRLYSVAFSPDGRRIVSGSANSNIRLWDAATGEQIGAFGEFMGDVYSVAFSPDGRRIVSGSSDNTLRLWDAATGEQIARFFGHGHGVLSVAFSPDGRRIVSGSEDRSVRLWDTATGEKVGAPLEGHEELVRSVAFSPDGRRVVSGSFDNTIRLWDVATGEQIGRPFVGHVNAVRSVAFSPNGRFILSGSEDTTARLWDAENGEPFAFPLTVLESSVTSLAYYSDSKRIVAGSGAGTISVLDPNNAEPVAFTLSAHGAAVTVVAVSSQGSTLASGADDATLAMWSAIDGSLRFYIDGHNAPITDLAFSPDGFSLASGSLDGTVRLTNLESGQHQVVIRVPDGVGVTRIAYSPGGPTAVTKARILAGGEDGTVWVIDVEDAKVVATLPASTTNFVSAILALSFSRDGRSINLLSADGVFVTADLVALAV